MTHKHAEYIKAWLDGETVECMYDGKWYKVEVINDFAIYDGFRKKPTHWYRVGLFRSGSVYTVSAHSDDVELHFPQQEYFVRWLTDRVYYEV